MQTINVFRTRQCWCGRIIAKCSFVLLTGVLALPAALANGAEIGLDAGGVFPLESQDIQLYSEYVTVYFGGIQTSRVECQYSLRNLTGYNQTISMAFAMTAAPGQGPPAVSTLYRRSSFQVQRTGGGKRELLPVHLVGVDASRWADVMPSPPDSLPAWNVSFGPYQEVYLNISYDTSWSGGCSGCECQFTMKYHAKPARLWAGSIESATIQFLFDTLTQALISCNPDNGKCLELTAHPDGFVQSSRGFMWQLRNWEPDHDFELTAAWSESSR